MTAFLRLLAEKDKASGLLAASMALRAGTADTRVFQVELESFHAVPGAPFAYWVSHAVRQAFEKFLPLEGAGRAARQGGVNGDDFRWLRLWFELDSTIKANGCVGVPIAKGGNFSPYYADIHLSARWNLKENTFYSFNGLPHRPSLQPASANFYFRPGLTWPRRTTSGLSCRVLPQGCIFADKGPAAFVAGDAPQALLALLALTSSTGFGLLVSLQLAATDAAARSYEVGVIQKTPVPDLSTNQQAKLADLARRAWAATRALDTVEETSHAFALPATLRARLGDYDPPGIASELACLRAEIDAIAFDLYGFAEEDRPVQAASGADTTGAAEVGEPDDDSDGEDDVAPADQTAGLLSWAAGVAFGRFDLRLATGERAAPPEPDPFDPLPAKSPGMLPDGDAPFQVHPGILVDDPGHPHDLARMIEDVLARVDCPPPEDVRRWLQRDFFPFHLQRYSKSRRKAPIYWPLSTASGGYTLWVYYPSLSSQTLYTAINDFLEPKLTDLGKQTAALRAKGDARTRDEAKALEALQELEQELIDLRDTLLRIAPAYRPDHDDGIQITAAPLWPLFRHRPWQKLLKETWDKLENGDYDWAHLAMAYWPARVRKKCETDRSLAIAHGLEDLYQPPPEVLNRTARQRKRKSREAEAP